MLGDEFRIGFDKPQASDALLVIFVPCYGQWGGCESDHLRDGSLAIAPFCGKWD
jgi:hypothetical protein